MFLLSSLSLLAFSFSLSALSVLPPKKNSRTPVLDFALAAPCCCRIACGMARPCYGLGRAAGMAAGMARPFVAFGSAAALSAVWGALLTKGSR